MPDIATLGLAIDSSPAAKAAADLDRLAATSKTVEAAFTSASAGISRSLDQAGRSAQAFQAAINASLGVQGNFGTAQRAADIAAYGRQLDALRAKFSPLFAAQQQYRAQLLEIRQALSVGAINQAEYAAAIERTKIAFAGQVTNLNGANAAILNSRAAFSGASRGADELSSKLGLSANQMSNLGFQINDVMTGLLMGQSPFMILTQQGGQFVQIAQMSEGGLRGMGSRLLGLITPARVAAAGLLGIAAGAALLYKSYSDQMNALEQSLRGVGRAAGVTAADLDNIATRSAGAAGISNAASRAMVEAYISTGEVGADNLNQLIQLTQLFSRATGQDATKATALLAQAMADPTKGVTLLQASIGHLSAGTVAYIQQLQASNNVAEAQRVLMEATSHQLDAVTPKVGVLAEAWHSVWNWIKNAGDAVGSVISKGLDGLPASQENLTSLRQSRATIASSLPNAIGPVAANLRTELAALDKQIADMQAVLDKTRLAGEQDRANKLSQQGAAIIGDINPQIAQVLKLRGELDTLNKMLADPATMKAFAEHNVHALGEVEDAQKRVQHGYDTILSDFNRFMQGNQLSMQGLTARSPAELGTLAAARQRLALAGSTSVTGRQADLEVAAAGALAQAQAQKALDDAAKERTRSTRDAIGAEQVELLSLGKTAEQADLLRMNWQTYADLRREAEQNNTNFDNDQYNRLVKQNEQLAALRQHYAQLQLDQQHYNQEAQFFGDQLVNTLGGLITGTESLSDALKNVTNALTNAILQAALLGQGPLASLFGTAPAAGAPNSVGGVFGTLFQWLRPSPASQVAGSNPTGAPIASPTTLAAPLGDVVRAALPPVGAPGFAPTAFQWTPLVNAASAQYGVNPSLTMALLNAESRGVNGLTSGSGAGGLMQLMPGTAQMMGVTNVMDPAQNIMGGTNYLSQMLSRYGGDVPRAIVGYNWGPGNADLWNGQMSSLPAETQQELTRIATSLGTTTDHLNDFSSTIASAGGSLGGLSKGFGQLGSSLGQAASSLQTSSGGPGGLLGMLGKIFGGSLSSGFTGDDGVNLGSSLNPLDGLTAADYGPGFAVGGFTGWADPRRAVGFVHGQEFVFDASAVRRIGVDNLERIRQLPGYAGGGPVGYIPMATGALAPASGQRSGPAVINFNVTDKAGVSVQAQQRQSGDGQVDIDVIIDKRVKQAISTDLAKGNGPVSKALEGAYGLRRTGVY